MDVDLPSSRGVRRSRSMSMQRSPPIILPMSTIRIVIINLFEMLNSYHSYSSEMDRGDPFTTPPTMLNIPEKHSFSNSPNKVIPNTKHSPTEEARRKAGWRARVEEPVKATQMTSRKIMMLLWFLTDWSIEIHWNTVWHHVTNIDFQNFRRASRAVLYLVI